MGDYCDYDCARCHLPLCTDPEDSRFISLDAFTAELDGLYLDDFAEDEAAYSERCFAEEIQFLMDIGNMECSEVGC
jgi:hypothetical protein